MQIQVVSGCETPQESEQVRRDYANTDPHEVDMFRQQRPLHWEQLSESTDLVDRVLWDSVLAAMSNVDQVVLLETMAAADRDHNKRFSAVMVYLWQRYYHNMDARLFNAFKSFMEEVKKPTTLCDLPNRQTTLSMLIGVILDETNATLPHLLTTFILEECCKKDKAAKTDLYDWVKEQGCRDDPRAVLNQLVQLMYKHNQSLNFDDNNSGKAFRTGGTRCSICKIAGHDESNCYFAPGGPLEGQDVANRRQLMKDMKGKKGKKWRNGINRSGNNNRPKPKGGGLAVGMIGEYVRSSTATFQGPVIMIGSARPTNEVHVNIPKYPFGIRPQDLQLNPKCYVATQSEAVQSLMYAILTRSELDIRWFTNINKLNLNGRECKEAVDTFMTHHKSSISSDPHFVDGIVEVFDVQLGANKKSFRNAVKEYNRNLSQHNSKKPKIWLFDTCAAQTICGDEPRGSVDSSQRQEFSGIGPGSTWSMGTAQYQIPVFDNKTQSMFHITTTGHYIPGCPNIAAAENFIKAGCDLIVNRGERTLVTPAAGDTPELHVKLSVAASNHWYFATNDQPAPLILFGGNPPDRRSE